MATILLESTSNESAGRTGTSPRRCSNFSNALESVKFCPNPRNMITSGLISQCIDVGDDIQVQRCRSWDGQLDIVLDSHTRPSLNAPPRHCGSKSRIRGDKHTFPRKCPQSSTGLVGQTGTQAEGGSKHFRHLPLSCPNATFRQAGIRCHLIYRPNQDMSGLISLFNAAVRVAS